MRAACIDIGSNTTRLIVAERGADGSLMPLVSERKSVSLAACRSASAMRLVACVAQMAATARDHGVAAGRIRIVATAVLRSLEAERRAELIANLERAAGCTVELLTAAAEARLAFKGATAGRDRRAGPVAVIDIGGGSTEVIIGRPGSRPQWWLSVLLGTRTLTEQAIAEDPPSAADIAAARTTVDRSFSAGLQLAGRPPAVARALTVGGHRAALGQILCGAPASCDSLADSLRTLTIVTAAEIAAHHGIDRQRARLLPATVLIMMAALAPLAVAAIPVGGGLREGVLLELLSDSQDRQLSIG